MAAWGRVSLTVATGGEGTAILGQMVSANYFDALGVRPALGRFFADDENRTPASHPVIVFSHAFWKSRLGGDPSALGRTVSVSGHPFTVIGVAPEPFRGIYTGLQADAWVPLMMQPVLRPRSNLTNASWLWLFGRLRTGATLDGAQHELSALTAARADELSGRDGARTFTAMRVAPLTGLPNGEGRSLLGFMGLLLAAAGLVLLIAGINVAGMLAARYIARGREMAVRAALGAGRARLLRQLLTEVLALFLLGAFGGFLVALFATAALERLPLPGTVPIALELSPDLRVFAFTLATSLAAGLVFGLAPAWRAARTDIVSRLRDDSPGSGSSRGFLMRGLITGQLALSLVLLVAAGLFLRALDSGQRIDPGFETAGVATALLEPESWGYDQARSRAFYRTLRARVEALPGVSDVSYTGRLPLMMSSSPDEITVDGSTRVPVHTGSVDAGYFPALRLPLVQGRAFRASDDEGAARVAVINETLARKAWPDGSAIGRVFRFRDTATLVVGIARDAKYATARRGRTAVRVLSARAGVAAEPDAAGQDGRRSGTARAGRSAGGAVDRSVPAARQDGDHGAGDRDRPSAPARRRDRHRRVGRRRPRAGGGGSLRADVILREPADARDRHSRGARRRAVAGARHDGSRWHAARRDRHRDRPVAFRRRHASHRGLAVRRQPTRRLDVPRHGPSLRHRGFRRELPARASGRRKGPAVGAAGGLDLGAARFARRRGRG